jgi:hypothetical protein
MNRPITMTVRSLPTVFDEIEERLAHDYQIVVTGERRKRFWRWAFPSFRDHFQKQADLWFANAFRVIRSQRTTFGLSMENGTLHAARVWSQFAATYEFASLRLEQLFALLKEEHDRTKMQLHDFRARADSSLAELNERMRKASAEEIERSVPNLPNSYRRRMYELKIQERSSSRKRRLCGSRSRRNC